MDNLSKIQLRATKQEIIDACHEILDLMYMCGEKRKYMKWFTVTIERGRK